jgi:hypothetical protein
MSQLHTLDQHPWLVALGGRRGLAHRSRRGDSLTARDFFLPGINVDAAYGMAFAASAVVGRPVVEHLYAMLLRAGPAWRSDRRRRRVLAAATLAAIRWSGRDCGHDGGAGP